MVLSARSWVALAAIAAAAIMMVQAAFAAPGNGDAAKPGWGYGDKNHVHTGPPGLSVAPGQQ